MATSSFSYSDSKLYGYYKPDGTAWFHGRKVDEEGAKRGRVDLRTFSQSFQAILCNNIAEKYGEFDFVSGKEYYDDDEDHLKDIFQWYIVDNEGAELLQREGNELLYYYEELNIYIWGVTSFGMPWNGLMTVIEILPSEEEYDKALGLD